MRLCYPNISHCLSSSKGKNSTILNYEAQVSFIPPESLPMKALCGSLS